MKLGQLEGNNAANLLDNKVGALLLAGDEEEDDDDSESLALTWAAVDVAVAVAVETAERKEAEEAAGSISKSTFEAREVEAHIDETEDDDDGVGETSRRRDGLRERGITMLGFAEGNNRGAARLGAGLAGGIGTRPESEDIEAEEQVACIWELDDTTLDLEPDLECISMARPGSSISPSPPNPLK
mmetsp:Transcript_32346/g.69266  ORF Transcript_32346/g.69266 Transcript_32346/m.69266 type:complete len:185 (-) Transcript_32346:857-1411(-)